MAKTLLRLFLIALVGLALVGCEGEGPVGPDGTPILIGTTPPPVYTVTPSVDSLVVLTDTRGLDLAGAQQFSPGYTVLRDDENGNLIYLWPNGGGALQPFTATPGGQVPPTAPSATVTATPAGATPTATTGAPPTATQRPPTLQPTLIPPTGNLLVNGDLEQDQGSTNGWTLFVERSSVPGAAPEINAERRDKGASALAVYSGNASLRIVGKWHCYTGGVYQIVPVTPGLRYTASAYSQVWANRSSDFTLPHDSGVYTQLSLGVDREGGVDPSASDIRWTYRDGTRDWRQQSVTVTAIGNRLTVFLRANLGQPSPSSCAWPLDFMMAFFDQAEVRAAP